MTTTVRPRSSAANDAGDGLLARGVGGKPGGEPVGPRADGSQSLAGDAARHRRIEIERDDRQLLPRGDRKERLVHADVRPAAGAPAQALVQVPGRDRAGERLIDIRLLVLLEHLEAERGPDAARHERLNHRALVGVVRWIIVLLAQVDDVGAAGAIGDHARRHPLVIALAQHQRRRAGRPSRSTAGATAARQRERSNCEQGKTVAGRYGRRRRTAASALRKRASSGLNRTASRQAASASSQRP